MDMDIGWIVAAIGGYLLGSLPFGILLTRAAGLGDIRKIGSGNIGATNVLRTGRKDIALATLLLDAGKAALSYFLAVKLIPNALPEMGMLAAFAALLGHCFSIFLGFKGGKGVATFFGGLLIAFWPVGVISGLIWLLTAFTVRISSFAALLAANAAPAIALGFGHPHLAVFAGLMALTIDVRHKDNIIRLMNGTEPKIGNKKKDG